MPGPYRAILYKEVYYMNTFTLKGTFLDTPAPDTLRVREGYLLCENGLCAGFSETAPAGVEVLDYTGKIITPGLVDLHLHAPQYSYCGTGDGSGAAGLAAAVHLPRGSPLRRPGLRQAGLLLFCARPEKQRHTRACIFATLHTDATLELMHQLRGAGLSAFVGKLGMDRNSLTATVSRPPPRVWPRRAAGWIPAAPKTPCTRAGAPDDHAALHPQHE